MAHPRLRRRQPCRNLHHPTGRHLERLRRRLEGVLPSHLLGTMAVIEVGGKTQFGPWVRLLEGFLNKTTGDDRFRGL